MHEPSYSYEGTSNEARRPLPGQLPSFATSASPVEVLCPSSTSQGYPPRFESSYPPAHCDCAECFSQPSSSLGVPQPYREGYVEAPQYPYDYEPAAGLPYAEAYAWSPPQQAVHAGSSMYRPVPSRVGPVPSGYALPSPPFPSPLVEDQLPRLGHFAPYPSQPLPPTDSRQKSYGRRSADLSHTPHPMPHVQSPVAAPPAFDRRRSSGGPLLESVIRRRNSGQSVDSRYGSEYSGGSDGGAEERTSTPFMTKLHYLVNNPELSPWIRWNADGTAFVFAHGAPELSVALARVFRHGNHHSFTRQLNIYAFKRLTAGELHPAVESVPHPDSPLTSADFSGFSHPLFFRDSPERPCDLTRIKPKVVKKASTKNLTSMAKAPTGASSNAGRFRVLRSDGKVGSGMHGRKL